MRSGKLYHGTTTARAADAIIRAGAVKPDMKPRSGSLFDPVAGRVYATTSICYAAIYALGADMIGHDASPFVSKYGDDGFIFELAPRPEQNISIDEDQLGELAAKGTVRWLSDAARSISTRVSYVEDEQDAFYADQPRTLWQAAADGDYGAWVQLGHVLLGALTASEIRLVLTKATQFAIAGPVPISKCWRLPRRLAAQVSRPCSPTGLRRVLIPVPSGRSKHY